MDFDRLEAELVGEVNSETDYWMRNDAKFRAAKQGATYEEFQQIVKGCHLQPLAKQDKLGGGPHTLGTIVNPVATDSSNDIPVFRKKKTESG